MSAVAIALRTGIRNVLRRLREAEVASGKTLAEAQASAVDQVNELPIIDLIELLAEEGSITDGTLLNRFTTLKEAVRKRDDTGTTGP